MISILVLVCATRAARANDWTEMGADAQQSRASTEQSGPTFTPAWSYTLNNGPILATPISTGGEIVVAGSISNGSPGKISALKATDGSELWTKTLEYGLGATPLASGRQLTVSTLGGQLYSLDLATGSTVWKRSFGGQNYSSPVFVPGGPSGAPDSIIAAAGFPSKDVWRLNALTGDPIWQTGKGVMLDLVNSPAAIAGNRVIIGVGGGTYQTLDLETGAPGSIYAQSGPLFMSAPLVVGNRIYTFPGDRTNGVTHLFAIDASTGAPTSGFPVAIPDQDAAIPNTMPFGQGPAISSPMTIGGVIVVQARWQDYQPTGYGPYRVFMREWVIGIDPTAARVLWQYKLANVTAPTTNDVPDLDIVPTPAGFMGPSGAYVAAGCSIAGNLVVLDAKTGAPQWTTTLPSAGRSSPVFSNGQLLIATDDSIVHAFSSMTNKAPTPPTTVGPSGAQAFAAAGMPLTWQGASDPEAGQLSYVVRLEKDGSPATLTELETPAGQAHASPVLEPNTAYLFAVRSRDAQGALSAWSVTQRLQVGANTPAPSSTGGTPVATSTPPPADSTPTAPPAPPVATSTPPVAAGDPAPSTPPATAPTAPSSCAPAASNEPPAMTGNPAAPSTNPTPPANIVTVGDSPATTDMAGLPTTATVSPSATGTPFPVNTMVPASTTTVTDEQMPAASMTKQADLSPSGGCSIGGASSSPMSILGVALLALVMRRRGRAARGEKPA